MWEMRHRPTIQRFTSFTVWLWNCHTLPKVTIFFVVRRTAATKSACGVSWCCYSISKLSSNVRYVWGRVTFFPFHGRGSYELILTISVYLGIFSAKEIYNVSKRLKWIKSANKGPKWIDELSHQSLTLWLTFHERGNQAKHLVSKMIHRQLIWTCLVILIRWNNYTKQGSDLTRSI